MCVMSRIRVRLDSSLKETQSGDESIDVDASKLIREKGNINPSSSSEPPLQLTMIPCRQGGLPHGVILHDSALIPAPNLDSILARPLPGSSLVSGSVCLVDMCDLRNERVVGVGICEHRADGEED
jgi:hypothetical protein